MHEPSQDTNTAIFCFLVSKKDKDGIKYALGIGLDIYKGTSLSDYIYFNDQESVKLLAKSGVNINKKDHKNITPLHLAVKENLNSMVNLLCQLGAHLYVENENGLNPIAVAALHEKRELVSILKMQADRVNLSWLDTIIQCARCKNENPLKLLKNEEVNIDEEDYDGETALFKAIRLEEPATVKNLLKVGAQPNKRSKKNEVPLSIAIGIKQKDQALEIIYSLVEKKANPCLGVGSNGERVLTMLIKSEHSDFFFYVIQKVPFDKATYSEALEAALLAKYNNIASKLLKLSGHNLLLLFYTACTLNHGRVADKVLRVLNYSAEYLEQGSILCDM